MEERRTISTTLLGSMVRELEQIAQMEKRRRSEVVRLLLKTGLRAYRRGRPLLCGYPHCTRQECCGGEATNGQILMFPKPNSEH